MAQTDNAQSAREAARKATPAILAVTLAVNLLVAFSILSKSGYDFSAFIASDVFFYNRYKPLFNSEVLIYQGGYDAGFYYLAATDLFEHRTFKMSYFYKRIILPAAMRLLASGRQEYFPYSFFFISMLATLAAAALLAAYLARIGVSPYWAVAFSISPGVVISAMHAGVDNLSLAFVLGGLLLTNEANGARAPRFAAGLLCLLLAALAKETSIVFCAALFLMSLAKGARARAFLFLLPAAGYFAWSFIVDSYLIPDPQYGASAAMQYNYTSVPFAGIAEWFRATLSASPSFSKLMEDALLPAAFMLFALATAICAMSSEKRLDSSFFPVTAMLAAMIPLMRFPLLNLFSCLRVFLPVLICFIILASRAAPRARTAAAAILIAAAVVFSAAFASKPAAPHFLHRPCAPCGESRAPMRTQAFAHAPSPLNTPAPRSIMKSCPEPTGGIAGL